MPSPRPNGQAISQSVPELLPLKAADFQILLVLLDGDLHPYGLMKEVGEQSAGKVRLELGSLYRVIDRLLREGLIEKAKTEDDDARRRCYSITRFGKEVARAEAERLHEVVELARSRRLVAPRAGQGRPGVSRLIHTLLRLFPRPFYEAHAREMLEVFRERIEAERHLGRWHTLGVYFRTAGSLVFAAALERLRSAHNPHVYQPVHTTTLSAGASTMDLLMNDLRFGLRMLAKQRTTTVIAIALLGLGIGANSAIFSLVDALLLRPLPVIEDPDRLVTMFTGAEGEVASVSSYMDYRDFQEQSRSFKDLAAYKPLLMDLSGDEMTERVQGMIVTEPYFRTLGVTPALGRFILPEEDETPGSVAVAVLGYELWSSRFAADPSIVGGSVRLNGRDFTVVGIAPRGFRGSSLESRPQVFAPMMMQPHFMPTYGNLLANRGWGGTYVIGRLDSGVSLAQARDEVTTIGSTIAERFPDTAGGRVYRLLPLRQGLLNPRSRSAVVPLSALLLAVVGTVLLTACFNVAHLQLARAHRRQREIAVRRALGANRLRLLRQLLIENLMLALLGGVAGIAITQALLVYLTRLPLPFEVDLVLDGRVAAFTFALATLTAVAFGLGPALRASRAEVTGLSSAAGRHRGPSGRFGRALVIGQVAASCCLLVLAGLFARSLINLVGSDPGFSPERTLVATLDPSLQGYDDTASITFYKRLMERVRALRGVRSASLVNALPGPNNDNVTTISIDGYTPPAGEPPLMFFNLVGLDYFETIQIPLREGRTFEASDDARATTAVVINEEGARRFQELTGRPALGSRMNLQGPDEPWWQIVGVVADSKTLGLRSEPRPTIYGAHQQAIGVGVAGRMTLLARTEGDPRAAVGAIREAVRAVDPNLPLVSVGTLEEHMSATLVQERLSTTLLLAAALLTLLLAAVGLYGLLTWSVSQRTAEIGIRMALGAAGDDLIRWVVREGFVMVLIGLALGLGLAAGAAQLATGFFYNVRGLDPVTWLTVFVVMSAVAFLASYLPARRATRIDPAAALRTN